MQNTETMTDDNNPRYLFTGISSDLLSKIVKGEIDPLQLAKKELENRGQDNNGQWVGFDAAEKIKL